jgi:hypothetical protein
MNKKVERTLKILEEDLETRKKNLEKIKKLPLTLIQEAFPEGQWYYTWIGQVEFIMPYTQAKFQVVRDFMKDQLPDYKVGRDFQCIWDSGGAGYFMAYSKDGISFDFAFRSNQEGSTCVMNKIGEKTVPVFEVVCSQEAAAEF